MNLHELIAAVEDLSQVQNPLRLDEDGTWRQNGTIWDFKAIDLKQARNSSMEYAWRAEKPRMVGENVAKYEAYRESDRRLATYWQAIVALLNNEHAKTLRDLIDDPAT